MHNGVRFLSRPDKARGVAWTRHGPRSRTSWVERLMYKVGDRVYCPHLEVGTGGQGGWGGGGGNRVKEKFLCVLNKERGGARRSIVEEGGGGRNE